MATSDRSMPFADVSLFAMVRAAAERSGSRNPRQ
jgi:hypothetical protein